MGYDSDSCVGLKSRPGRKVFLAKRWVRSEECQVQEGMEFNV